MRKNGFTLIELLAVIVILAIIALIAVPIVLNIIEDTKNSATIRSADFYIDAVELSIAQAILDGGSIDGSYTVSDNGNICKTEDNCITVEVSGDTPDSGSTITITNGQISNISLNYDNKTVIKNTEGSLVFSDSEVSEGEEPVCTLADDSGATGTNLGAKYLCKVKEEMEEEYEDGYAFYVLSNNYDEDGNVTSTNLIMDQNINSDGTPAGMTGVTQSANPSKYNLVAWISDSTYGCGSDGDECATNVKGPITAMQFLYNATKDWTNIDPLNYTYNDKATQGTTSADTSYTSFVSSNGVAIITSLSGDEVTTIGTSDDPLRARMPIYSNDASITEVANKTDVNAYLYDNLDLSGNSVPVGYWTLSSSANWSTAARGMLMELVESINVHDGIDYGVRPVITVKL